MIRALPGLLQAHGEAQGAVEMAPPDLKGMLMHELADGKEIAVEVFGWGKTFELPAWNPIQLGPVALDLSPTKHMVFLVLAAVVCVTVLSLVGRVMRRKYRDRAPSGFANAVEAMVIYFRDEVVRRSIGPGADRYTPYILTLFFFILTMNLMGLVPFGATPTGNINVTAALAILTFVVVEVSGMRALGPAGYARTIFFVPPGMSKLAGGMMLIIMTPVEFIGKLTKPFALTIRLFANMTAGHTLVLSLLGLIFMFGHLGLGKYLIAGASVGMVVAIFMLEIFVAFLQAYIFALLTAVFIGLIRHAH
ncbi:MAG: F0F1 ATP synthase subunit A [Gemmatimonadota bacterium]|nr:MAG: F0F1 ATP synthase subunit A [Gemmatimonadota bacterium]